LLGILEFCARGQFSSAATAVIAVVVISDDKIAVVGAIPTAVPIRDVAPPHNQAGTPLPARMQRPEVSGICGPHLSAVHLSSIVPWTFLFSSSADAPRPDCSDPLSAPGIIAWCDLCFTHFREVRIASPPCMLCLGHTRAKRKTQPPGAQDRQNIYSLLPTWLLLPWQGNGNDDGPGGTATTAARGGTR
jgi:hypothetical protein